MKDKGKLIISFIAVITNLLLAAGKVIVGIISKSTAIIADGINSSTDVIASLIGYIGIKAADKPADKEHPYGHGKAEVISGFIITLIIFISGIWILYDAIKGFFNDQELSISYLAFIVMGSSALINGIMSYVKVHYGKRYDSISLVSDGVHSRIDLIVSLAIFIGLFFIRYYSNIDSILAILVGSYIIKESLGLGKESTDLLIGRSAEPEIEDNIKGLIKKQGIELDDLKTQKKGSLITANIKIKLPKDASVDEATSVSKDLRKQLLESIPNLQYIAIQVEALDFSEGYYKPPQGLGKAIRWKGRMPHGKGLGPQGYCVCKKCNEKVKHVKGVPCYKTKCPNCGSVMTREI